MRVRMNVSIAGHEFSYAPRQVVDLSDDLARAWLECGHASPVDDEPTESSPVPTVDAGTDNEQPRTRRARR